ncbi:DUF4157 domain-containing protein [Montanilutibacter psychrotolerans]|uniref:eCIS core domain-containing protein n=1 Tax=Montanilutibacter psychrotolerans TaxID=1327343 RepID=UPI001CC1EBA9|nr:DUF4157 domain-containing protein [Lysobacter psychrotolerans]
MDRAAPTPQHKPGHGTRQGQDRGHAKPRETMWQAEQESQEEQAQDAEADAPKVGVPVYLGAVQRKGGDGGDAPSEGASGAGAAGGAGQAGGAAASGAAGEGGGLRGPAGIRAIADGGVSQAGQALPGLDRIQASFGRHDVSGVRVQVGGVGGDAAARLSARAYTLGDRIAFRSTPDLRLAAHEAAHVIQQRRGVSLANGVGRHGDRYEQHADEVARRVTAGESAEDLLDAGGSGGAAVQRECDCGGAGCSKCGEAQEEDQEPAGVQREVDPSAIADTGAGTDVAVQRECDCGGSGCSACRDEEASAPAGVQMELDVNATRQFEAMAAGGNYDFDFSVGGGGGGAPGASAESASSTSSGGEGAAESASDGEAAGPEAAADAGGGGGGASADSAPAAADGGAAGEADSAPGAVSASCYNADIEEPDEERESEPAEPPKGDVKEDVDAELPEPEGGDDCPVGDAVAAAAPPAGGAAGGGEGAAAGAPAGGGDAAAPASGDSAGEATGESAGDSSAGAGAGPGAGGPGGGDGGESAAPAEGGAVASPAGGLDAAIAGGEAGRDGAVAGYAAAKARLGEVGMAARPNAAPIGMAQAEPGQREIAAAANGFFSSAAGRLDSVVSEALSTVPARLGGLAESIKGGIGAAIEAEKSAVSGRIAAARAQAFGSASSAVARVLGAHSEATGQINAAADAALAALDGAYPDILGRIDDAESSGLDDISQAYADSRTNHNAIGKRIGGEATARGAEYVAQYDQCKIHRRDSWTAGWLTDRRAEAQQEAATKTADGYRRSLEDAGKKAGYDLVVQGRPRDRCGLIAIANRARDSLDAQYTSLVGAIEAGRGSAIGQADAARDQLLRSVGSALGDALGALDAQEAEQRQAANDTGYLQQVAIEQAAHAAAASVLSAIADAVDGVSGLLRSTRGEVAGLADAEPAAAARQFDAMRGAVDAGMGRLMVQALTGVAMAEASLLGSAASSYSAMAQLSESHSTQTSQSSEGTASGMRSLADSGCDTLSQQASQYAQQTASMAEQGLAGFETIASGAETGATTMVGNIRTTLGKAETDLEKGLRKSLGELDSPAKGIPKHARVAASKEQPAWKSVVKWVLIIAIIVVVALVIGPAVIGAVGAAAGALGASAAAASVIGTVVGGAIVGAATSATIQVINNAAAGESLLKGVGRAAIMGAIGGAFGGAAGQLIGKAAQAYQLSGVTQFALNVAADTVLEIGTSIVTGEFSWDALGMSVLMSVVTGGFGEVPKVKAVQARVQHGAASSVPGSGAARFADSIRPPAPSVAPRTAADVEVAGTPKSTASGETGPTAPARPHESAEAPKASDGRTAAPDEPGVRPADADADAPAPRPADADAPAKRPVAGEPDAPSSKTDEGGAPHKHEDVDAAAGRAGSQRAEGPELAAPAKGKSDTELVESTAKRSKVGEEDHVNAFRKNGDRVECEICSLGCGRVRDRIQQMEDALPVGHPARAKLEALRAEVARVEAAIEGRGMSLKDVIDASAGIANKFREIGAAHPEVGKGIDNPRSLKDVYDLSTGAKPGFEPIRTDNLGVKSDPPEIVPIGKAPSLKAKPGEQVIYVLRDATTGAVLKVGKVRPEKIAARFNVYKNAGVEVGLKLEIEVTRVRELGSTKVEQFENALRMRLEQEGHIMPFDNSPESGRLRPAGTDLPTTGPITRQGRLGFAGPGTPYDSRSAKLRKSHDFLRDGPRKGILDPRSGGGSP